MLRSGLLRRIFVQFVFLLTICLGWAWTQTAGEAKDASASKPAGDRVQPTETKPDDAKTDPAKPEATATTEDQSGDPLKRPIVGKQRKEHARALRKELRGEYRK